MDSPVKDFEKLEELTRKLHAASTLTSLVQIMVDETQQILSCEKATVFRLEEKDSARHLYPFFPSDELPKGFRSGQGIAGFVAQTGNPILSNEPNRHGEFLAVIDGYVGTETHCIISVPILSMGQTLGVLQALNQSQGTFTSRDLRWLHILASHGAIAWMRLGKENAGWDMLLQLSQAVASMVDERYGTVGHVDRVQRMAAKLGQNLDLSHQELRELTLIANLHDVGRLGIAPELLKGLYTTAPETAQNLEQALNRTLFQRLQRGRPIGNDTGPADKPSQPVNNLNLALESQSVHQRILSIVDTFDLLTIGSRIKGQNSDLSPQEALQVIRDRAQSEFTPSMVKAFIESKPEELERRATSRFQSNAPMTLRMLDEQNPKAGTNLEIRGLDLSESGAQFWCNQSLPTKGIFELKVSLPTGDLTCFARVARQISDTGGKGYQIGVYFLGHG